MLEQEDPEVALKYKNRSVAEQRSLDLSWDLLMEKRFSALRKTICHTSRELSRFRQLLVNAVMATDLGDKELKELRNSRWDKAFSQSADLEEENSDSVSMVSFSMSVASSLQNNNSAPVGVGELAKTEARNRKATIVVSRPPDSLMKRQLFYSDLFAPC